MRWTVELRCGPLRLWRTDDPQAVAATKHALLRRLLTVARTSGLPEAARTWAQTRLKELSVLETWGDTGDD